MRKRCSEYLERAEKIKQHLEEAKVSKTGNSKDSESKYLVLPGSDPAVIDTIRCRKKTVSADGSKQDDSEEDPEKAKLRAGLEGDLSLI